MVVFDVQEFGGEGGEALNEENTTHNKAYT